MVTPGNIRTARYRDKKRQEFGLVEVRVWVPPSGIVGIRQMAADMVSQYRPAAVADGSDNGGGNG